MGFPGRSAAHKKVPTITAPHTTPAI